MSKIIKAISLICLIIIAGCSQDVILIPDQQIQEGEEVAVSFNTIIPEFKTVVTRANGGVNDMYLLVFDENGNVKACTRTECMKLIDLLEKKFPNEDFGNMRTGFMDVEKINNLMAKL